MGAESEGLRPTSVMIVDDQRYARLGLALMIRKAPDLHVVAEAGDGQEALEILEGLNRSTGLPDVVLMDVRMPRGSGLWASKRILAQRPDVRIIVMTTFDLDSYLFEALDLGTSGFLLKDSDPDRLVSAIHTVAKGGCVVSDSLVGRLVSELSRRKGQPSEQKAADHREHGLTDREAEVIKLLAEGRSNRDIADELYLEISTVKAHVGKIVSKLGVHNRVQIAIWAFATGMATPRIGNHGGSQHA